MAEEYWVCVREDEVGLWTADLYNGKTLIKNIGGSYPRSEMVSKDARLTWGVYNVKVIVKNTNGDKVE